MKIRKGTQVWTPSGYPAVVTFEPKDGFAITRYSDDSNRPPGRRRATFAVSRLSIREEQR